MTAVSAKDLAGMPVVDGRKGKRIGKVRDFVFHPEKPCVVGFSIQRRDALLMVRRKDLFVRLRGFDVENGSLVVRDDPTATGEAACRKLGIDWDSCVLWIGMPLMTEEGDALGSIEDVFFNPYSGEIEQLVAATGKTKDALLGRRVVEAAHIVGFRRGQGIALAIDGRLEGADEVAATQRGAVIVDSAAARQVRRGGMAEAAGAASALVTDKVRKGVERAKQEGAKAKEKASAARADVAPELRKATAEAGEAIGKGAYAAGEHVARLGGMFSAFKDEFVKGMNGEYDDER